MIDKIIKNVGELVTAKKDMFMSSNSITPNKQFLTAKKQYTIVAPPKYYDTPIEIMDDDNMIHSCPTSYFK